MIYTEVDNEAIREYAQAGNDVSYCHADDSCGDWRFASQYLAKMRQLEAEYPHLADEFANLKATSHWLL